MQASSSDERRVVTVVFADLVGYTTLSEHVDPERVKRIVDGAFRRLIADVDRFGGQVDKLLGDGLLALFGAPIAHEDDPGRAVRTALEMHATLARFVEDEPDIDRRLQLRVGVNTGEVVVGSVPGTDDYTAMGDVVNVASRLQSMAPPGGVYVGSTTEALLGDEFVRELVADAEVRGREQTERVWSVTGRAVRAVSSGAADLPFVGRETQRELLASIMGLVASGQSAVVAVSGEAGSGKTRLITEALDTFPHHDVAVFSGVCAPYGETNVWAPVADAVFGRIDLDRSAAPELLRRTICEWASDAYAVDGDSAALTRFVETAMHLLGHPSELDDLAPAQARDALFQTMVEGIRRRSAHGPVVVWIDDLQWADPLVIDLMTRISRSLADRAVLVLTAQRDDAEIVWPPAIDHPITVRMPLEPLSRDESERLIAAVLGRDPERRVADQLYERSGGNPLYLRELAAASAESGGDEQLPGSLRGLIASRLDRLSAGQRAIVDNAAVLGTHGPLVALSEFAEALEQTFVSADLDALIDDGVLEVDEERGWWQFRSDVVREVAYQTLTKSARAQRHAGTAAVMLHFDAAPIDQVAHHAACAAELADEIGPVEGVLPTMRETAIDLLVRATHRSMEMGAFNQAIRHATRAIALRPEDAGVACELLLLRAEAATERRETDRAIEDASSALEHAIDVGNQLNEGIARRILGVVAQQNGDLESAREQLDASVELLRSVGDERELATSLSDRGFAEVFGGSLVEAGRILAEAEELVTGLGDRRQIAWVRQHQAWVAFLSGDVEIAEEQLAAASGMFEELGDRSGTGWAFGLLAYLRFYERRFAEAEELARRVREDTLELGERWAPAMMDSLVASIRLWTGRFSEAEELSRRALHGFRELNDRFGIVQALAPRMRALVALGRAHEAERSLEEAISLSESFGDLAFPTMAAAGTAAHLGLGERAVSLGEVAVERIEAMHADGREARITLALGQCQVGDPERALATLLEVEPPTPYAHAVRAIAHAMVGDNDLAIADADVLRDFEGSSYLDRVIADVAAAGAHHRQGDDGEAERRIRRARAEADAAGDAVARSLAACAGATLLGSAGVDPGDHLGAGWHRVIEGLTGVAPHPAWQATRQEASVTDRVAGGREGRA